MPETAPATEPNLTWRPVRDANTDEILDAERICDLFDEDVWVGHARFLEHGSTNNEPGKARIWILSVLPFPGFGRGHTITMGSRERSKEEAKAAAEAAYRRICDISGAREKNLKHSRELMEMRANAQARIAAGGGPAVPQPADNDAEDEDLDDDLDEDEGHDFRGAFDPPLGDFADRLQALRVEAAEAGRPTWIT